jgi:hypothetical protein
MSEPVAERDAATPPLAAAPEPDADAEPDDEHDADAEGSAGEPVTKVRRRAPGADPAVRSFGTERTCAADGCETKLSRYNPDSFCSMHRGWDRQVVTRRRRPPS